MATSSGPASQQARDLSSVEVKRTNRLARPDIIRSVLGGFLGTVAMTMMMYFLAPKMLGHPMDIAKMLGSMLGGNWWAGMAMHFINGTLIFPLIYAYFLYRVLPGGPAVKGTVWGVVLWLLAQVVVMPLIGAGFFSGSTMAAMSSCIGHVVYGGLLGWVAGSPK
ncbi:MAG TPA: DUF6789 family protein [Pirellulales bacterium]|nr:DUF6789 family protein [Pirellulales bacterium]